MQCQASAVDAPRTPSDDGKVVHVKGRMPALRRGTNLARIAGFNEAVIIDAIRRSRGGLSRVELTQATGLSAQTISNISRRMIEAGLVQEGERVVTGVGKPRTMLTLDPTGQYAVGVHLDPLVMTFVVLDFTGSVVVHTQTPTPTAASPDEVMDYVTNAIDALVADAGIDEASIAGIGFASPGPIDAQAGVILDPPHLPGWRNVPLRDHLRETSELPVLLDKDVIAAAVGERWAGATMGYANSLFVYLSTGVGVGITIDDAVVRGLSSNAGDVGHLVVDPDGPPCDCGLRGCLGASLSPYAFVRAAVDRKVLPAGTLRGTQASDPAHLDHAFDALVAAAEAGDDRALEIIRVSSVRLAKAVDTLANLVDSEVVTFGGPTWSRLWRYYLDQVPELVAGHLVRGALGPLQIRGTALGEDVVAIGAACLVLDRAFSPHAASFALGS